MSVVGFLRVLLGDRACDIQNVAEIEDELVAKFSPNIHPEDRDLFVCAVKNGDTATLARLVRAYGLRYDPDGRLWYVDHPWK